MSSDEAGNRPRPTHLVPFDNRQLAVDVVGDRDAHPVFLMHGMPGSRVGPRPRPIVLYRLGVRLISYDRPGYGRSDRKPGRTVYDAGADVAAIADHLRLDHFSVVGRSGGGPHALAAAAYNRGRVDSAAVLVGAAPSDAQGLDWYEGMVESNLEAFSAADRRLAMQSRDPAGESERREISDLVENLRARASEVSENPERLIETLGPDLTPADLRVIQNVGLRALLIETYREAVSGREISGGWVDDALALRRSWGFKLGAVQCPVLLWHGMNDRFVPVSHTEWLADQLRATRLDPDTVQLRLAPGMAHFGAVEILPEVLGWLAKAAAAARAEAAAAVDQEPAVAVGAAVR